ncbi:MAG: EamA family transporter [Gemmatimonadota bacterium]|nr:MAG: EamA family transporter [Gemmatimonadota bacterium]
MATLERPDFNDTTIQQIAAFGAIYLIWGSTYLAIRYAIETLPPLFMMGSRSVVAGAALYAFARLRGAERPDSRHWRSAVVAGILLFLIGHGGLAWAEQRLTSGVAALVSATTPLWIILLVALQKRGRAISGRVLASLLLGIGGVAFLIGPAELLGSAPVDPLGTAVLLLADVSWAAGSVYASGADFPRSPSLTAGMGLLTGGSSLLLVSCLSGETTTFDSISARSICSLLYLVLFGSIIAFAAYTWLLRVTSPARVSSHSFVNPAVAVLLGCAIGGEALSARTVLAALAMITGAAAIVADGTMPDTSSSGSVTEGRGELAAASCSSNGPRAVLQGGAATHC